MIGEKQQSLKQPDDQLKRQCFGWKVQRAAWLIAVAGLIAAASLLPGQALPMISAVGIYFLLMIVFRLAGKRTIANLTTFDLILLLIISEATQQTMVRDNNSFTNASLLVITLVAVDVGMSMLKMRFKWLDELLEGRPMVVVEDGRSLPDCMRFARINEADVLSVARENQGILRMEEIQLAVLETGGGISIIPRNHNNHQSNDFPRGIDCT